MNARHSLIAIALVITTAAITTTVVSQQAQDTPGTPPARAQKPEVPDQMTPGPAHKFMAKYVGEYTTKVKFTAPGQETMESEGKSRITSMLDGRFFLDENTGVMMSLPYKALHYTGYNNGTKQYESCWTWNMDTGMLNLTGTSDDEGKTINWKGAFTNPAGEKENLIVTTRHIDDDHFTIEMRGEGDEAGAMITEYTRVK